MTNKEVTLAEPKVLTAAEVADHAEKLKALAFSCGAAATRITSRIQAIIERDGSERAATTGPGFSIGYLLAKDIESCLIEADSAIAARCETIELLRAKLESMDVMTQNEIRALGKEKELLRAENTRLKGLIEGMGHEAGCRFQTEEHCANCKKPKSRHDGQWLNGHCPDGRGRPLTTSWSALPPHPCNCVKSQVNA